jgi:hypothetical protein
MAKKKQIYNLILITFIKQEKGTLKKWENHYQNLYLVETIL